MSLGQAGQHQRLEESVNCSIDSIFKMWLVNAGFLEPVGNRDMACGNNPAGLGPPGSGFTAGGAFPWVGDDGHKELRGKQEGRGAEIIFIQTGPFHAAVLP